MDNEDFLTAMENFEDFLAHDITEDRNSDKEYPVGIGYKDVRIHFMHYPSFDEAKKKWDERKERINFSNLIVWMTNYDCVKYKDNDEIIQRFGSLPFKNKLIFSGFKSENENVVRIKDIEKENAVGTLWRNSSVWGKRYMDRFDFIKYLNSSVKEEPAH